MQLRAQRSYAGLNVLLGDGRIRHAFTDGRAFILKGGRKYDVIEADALRPASAYSGNLYSREYFDLLRRHLKPGGLVGPVGADLADPGDGAERLPPRARLPRAPHRQRHADPLGPGGDPRADAASAFTDSFYRRGHVDIAALIGRDVLSQQPTVYGPSSDRSTTDINLDLFPRDEYLVGASFRPGHGRAMSRRRG